MTSLFGGIFGSGNGFSEEPDLEPKSRGKKKEGDGKKKKKKKKSKSEMIDDLKKENKALLDQYQKVRQRNVDLKRGNEELEKSNNSLKKNLDGLKKDSLSEMEKERAKTKKWMEKCVEMSKKKSGKGKSNKKDQTNEKIQILEVERDSAIANYEKLEQENKRYAGVISKIRKEKKKFVLSHQNRIKELELEVKKYKYHIEELKKVKMSSRGEGGAKEGEVKKDSFDSPTEEIRKKFKTPEEDKDSMGMNNSFFEYDNMMKEREEKKKRISGEFESLLSTINFE